MVGSSSSRLGTNWLTLAYLTGMIWVTTSSPFSTSSGSLPEMTGRSLVFAVSWATIVRMRPLRMTAHPFFFSTELSTSTASSFVSGSLLHTSTVPRTSVSLLMMKPAASLR